MEHTILQIQSNGRISLPRNIRKQARISKGEYFEATLGVDGTLCLKPTNDIGSDRGNYLNQRRDNFANIDRRFTSMDELEHNLEED
jgi:bifunctional DNA-binding transcriptional regulator/antitoxin component of YhaV-PrlF toxin-antitoxin module